MGQERPKKKTVNRRLRTELVWFNGVPVRFYRDKQGRWSWRSFGGRVQIERLT